MRIIDVKPIQDALRHVIEYGIAEADGSHTLSAEVVLSAIDKAPKLSARAFVTHGHWNLGKCSKCGNHAPYWSMSSCHYKSNYCPNCGARMIDESEEEQSDEGA